MGILIGMILGAVIVAVAVLFFNRDDNPFTQSKPAQTAEAPSGQSPSPDTSQVSSLPGKPGDQPVEKQNFTFFNELPKGESASSVPPRPSVQTQGQTSQQGTVPAPAVKQTYLQLAAFERAEQADDLKAQLLLMGLDPVTQRAQLPDGRVVHRIRIGPFTNKEDVKAMRARLSAGGFTVAEEVSN
ncbi:MAG: SPOR domain-containing protein [Azoarcus sp.]|jgi:cell division protein FtsN|nr:SPOR domain-containing protein [Azoarcus sp.]